MHRKYVVRLSDDERGVCQEISKTLKGSSQKFRRAQMLLKADADGPGWPDVRIAKAFNCREQTIEPLRKRLVTEGFAWALEGKKHREPPTPPFLGSVRAQPCSRREAGTALEGLVHSKAGAELLPAPEHQENARFPGASPRPGFPQGWMIRKRMR